MKLDVQKTRGARILRNKSQVAKAQHPDVFYTVVKLNVGALGDDYRYNRDHAFGSVSEGKYAPNSDFRQPGWANMSF